MAARENSRAFPKNTRVKFTSRVLPGGGGWTIKEQTTQKMLHKSEIHIILKEEDKD